MPQLAVCPTCNKRYRVPDHKAAARCKVCRVQLEFEDPEPSGDDGSAACPGCGAAVEPSAAFCEACGEALSEDAPAASHGEKRLAASQMRKAMGRVKRLKLFLVLGLIGESLALLVLVGYLLLSDEYPVFVLVALAIQVLIVGLLIYGLRNLERRPFPIALSLALLRTLIVAIGFLGGGIPVVSVFAAVYFWAAAGSAAQVERIAREHPDLFLARRMRGETKQGSTGRRQQRIERDRKAAARRKWVVLGAVGSVLILIGIGAQVVSMQPEEQVPESMVVEFRDAWNAASVERIAQLGDDDNRGKLERGLTNVMQRYEWGTQLPRIDSFEMGPSDGEYQRVEFATVAGALPVGFRKAGGRWSCRSVSFKQVNDWRP